VQGQSESRRVLVVDDEPRVLSSIEDLLEDEFEVLTSADAQEALNLLEEQEVAVVLSDQRMPGLTGDQLLSRAREVSGATRVLITGYADLEAVTRAVNSAQIYAYVAKPWDVMALRATVQRAADHYKMARALRESEERLRGLVERLPEGVCLLDGERRVVLANSTGEEYLRTLAGVRVGEVISHIEGRGVEDLLEPRPDGLAHEVVAEGPPQRIFEVEARPTPEGGWVLVVREVTQEDHLEAVRPEELREVVLRGMKHFVPYYEKIERMTAALESCFQEIPEEALGRAGYVCEGGVWYRRVGIAVLEAGAFEELQKSGRVLKKEEVGLYKRLRASF
jgi:CheY-like chemotaxis protein